MSKTRLETTLNEWRAWPVTTRPTVIRIFSGGLNHEVFLIRAGTRELVLKLFSKTNKNAIDVQQWAAGLKLSPEILFTSDKYDYALMESVPQPSVNSSNITRQNLKAIATGLNTIHNADFRELGETVGRFDLFKFCHHYLGQLDKQSNYQNLVDMHQALAPALKIFIKDDYRPALCHNDLVAENYFISEAGVSFIDWEYAQIHNPWFDLAAIIAYLHLDDSDATLFLDYYQSGLGAKTNTDIFYASQIALLWGDILWHLDKFSPAYLPKLKNKLSTLNNLSANLNINLPSL